jgi:hypothetical protein
MLAQKTTTAIGKHRSSFGCNRECDFFGGRAADVESDSEFQPVMRESLDSKSVVFSISPRASE